MGHNIRYVALHNAANKIAHKKFSCEKVSDIGIGPGLMISVIENRGTGPCGDLLGES
jgi:hypothetical protein